MSDDLSDFVDFVVMFLLPFGLGALFTKRPAKPVRNSLVVVALVGLFVGNFMWTGEMGFADLMAIVRGAMALDITDFGVFAFIIWTPMYVGFAVGGYFAKVAIVEMLGKEGEASSKRTGDRSDRNK